MVGEGVMNKIASTYFTGFFVCLVLAGMSDGVFKHYHMARAVGFAAIWPISATYIISAAMGSCIGGCPTE
jgi:hypothetical protein